MTPIIRALTPADAPAFLDLYRAAAGPGSGLARQPDEMDAAWAEATLAQACARGLSLGAFAADGRLLGEIHALRLPTRQFQHVLGDLVIGARPEARGQGIGSALFEALFERARALDPPIRRVELFCREGNLGGVRLYECLGFEVEGRLRARVVVSPDLIEDDLVMGRAI